MRAPKVEVKEDPVLAAVEKRNQENDFTSIQKDVQGQTSQLSRFATRPVGGSQSAPILAGYLNLDVSAMDLSSGDETYKLFLLGSNDPAWGNGNVEMLAARDFAAASAGRLLGTICPASYPVPMTGRSATKFMIPFTNLIGAYQLRYLQLYAQLAGATPSLTLSAWVSPDLA